MYCMKKLLNNLQILEEKKIVYLKKKFITIARVSKMVTLYSYLNKMFKY